MKTSNPIILAAAFLLTLNCTVNATAPFSTNPGNPIELRYTGTIDNNPLFQLKINGAELNGSYKILITDKFGVTLYTENIAKGNFSKTFLFDRDDLGNEPLKVEIINQKDKRSVVYEINSDTRTWTENTVTRIF